MGSLGGRVNRLLQAGAWFGSRCAKGATDGACIAGGLSGGTRDSGRANALAQDRDHGGRMVA